MAKRVIGAERLFSLGDYKNVRLIESMEFDDEGLTDIALDALRFVNILNLYAGFALHQSVLQDVKEAGFDPRQVMEMVLSKRQNVEETLANLVEVEEVENDG